MTYTYHLLLSGLPSVGWYLLATMNMGIQIVIWICFYSMGSIFRSRILNYTIIVCNFLKQFWLRLRNLTDICLQAFHRSFSFDLRFPFFLFLAPRTPQPSRVSCSLEWLWNHYEEGDDFELICLPPLRGAGLKGICHYTQFCLFVWTTR